MSLDLLNLNQSEERRTAALDSARRRDRLINITMISLLIVIAAFLDVAYAFNPELLGHHLGKALRAAVFGLIVTGWLKYGIASCGELIVS